MQTEFSIEGMTCASCSTRVERALKKAGGVENAVVNLTTERARIEFSPDTIDLASLMDIVERAGFGARLDEDEAEEKTSYEIPILIGAALLSLPLVLPMLVMPFGLDWSLPGWVQFALALPVQLIAGARFYIGAYKAAKAKTTNMDTLVSIGTTAAFLLSLSMLWRGIDHLYFESAAVVITLILVGKYMEGRAKRSTTEAIKALSALQPTTAAILRDGTEVSVSIDEVVAGDIVIVRPGERLPVDGVVDRGISQLDESALTGESMPVTREEGDEVKGGSINGEALLHIRATHVGETSLLARIVRLVEDAQADKPEIQKTVDKIAAVFVPAVLAIAAMTFIAWWLIGAEMDIVILRAAAVLVIACPCALGLATPAAIMVGTGAAARAGILIADPDSLEQAASTTMVIFDKTGTLTKGQPEVQEILADDEDALLRLVAAAQSGSEHPLGRAILQKAEGMELQKLDSFVALPGRGLLAVVEGQEILVGSRRLMGEREIDISQFEARAIEAENQGMTVMWAAKGGAILGAICVGDVLREDAPALIARLAKAGIKTSMLTGDNERTARFIASKLGDIEVVAEVLPDEKAAEVKKRKAAGETVLMVGDGVNDAPALAAADASVAMGTGSDIAMHTAGITLMRPVVGLVADAILVARATRRKIWQNLFWAFIFNTIGIPLAALGYLSPMMAGGAMAFSSVTVVSNALLLKRWRAQA